MSFFADLFRRKDAAFYLDRARKALGNSSWVEARDAADDGLRKSPSPELEAELNKVIAEAHAGISHMNLEEGRLSAEAGELERATDLFMVAMEHALTEASRREIQREIDRLDRRAVRRERGLAREGGERRGPAMRTVQDMVASDRDDDTPPEVFEIYLAGLVPQVAEIYRSLGVDFAHGYVALNEGEGRQAYSRLSLVKATGEGSAYLAFERARAALAVGNIREAMEGIKQIKSVHGYKPLYLSGQPCVAEVEAEVYAASQDWNAALGAFRAGLDEEKDSLTLKVGEIQMLARLQRHDEAVSVIEDHLKRVPKAREMYLLYHQVELARGRPERAAQVLEQGMSRCCGTGACSAQDREIPRALATHYLRKEENPKRVEALLNQLFLGQGGEGDWIDHYLRARYYHWQGDDIKARRNWETALKKCPPDDPRYGEVKNLYA